MIRRPDQPGFLLSRRSWLAGALGSAIATRGAAASARFERFTAGRAGEGIAAHDELDGLLRHYVRAGQDRVNRVDYSRWRDTRSDRSALDAYVRRLTALEPGALMRDEQFAYWANLYNALTVRVVLDAYPVQSIRNIKPHILAIGPWKTRLVRVQGIALSLDDIEHGILRSKWREPRVHYAVNCASIGCPNLRLRAFRGARLEEDLAHAARDYVNHPRGARFEGERLLVSSIYRWYREDFGGSDAGVIAHLTDYADERLRSRLATKSEIDGDGYDWTLNDKTGQNRA